ncbi:MAG: serine hydrolase [Erythrobacter sp.]
MQKLLLAAAAATLAFTSPVAAQSAQERLDGRYDRALAAGYKALMLCSAIANAEANGATRTPESVHEWELKGIQAPLNDIVQDLIYEIVRRPTGQVAHVAVDWADDMPPRVAVYFQDKGCSALPIGAPEDWSEPEEPVGEEPREPVPDDMVIRLIGRALPKPTAPPPSAVDPVFDAAIDGVYGKGSRTTAMLVRRLDEDGNLLSESAQYTDGFDENTPQRTWSVAKSIAATFVGGAVESEHYAVDDSVKLNYWRRGDETDPRNAITIDHMLRMASGRYSDTPGNRTDPLYWGGATVDEHATGWPLVHKPGTVFRYANNDTLMAIKAIDLYLEHYRAPELFAKLGMNNTVAETDMRGNYVLSSQVWSTASDLATLGQLYLNDGVLPNGERFLPENWREYVSDPSGPQPIGRQWGYGAGWWTFKRPEGNAFEGIPDDAFAARGNRGQYVVVVPSRNVVIVRRGEDMVGTRFDIAAFTRDVLTALEEGE